MADPAPPDPAPPPRASLLGLPTEIKASIVKLARQQDENYRERMSAGSPKERELAALLTPGWHGRSANALFLVNKELSGLAEVYVFEVRRTVS